MATIPNVEIVYLNAWQLRCIFNQSRIASRYVAGEFTVAPRDQGNASSQPDHPKDTRGHMYTFRDLNGIEVATAHRYTAPNGFETPFDPKTVKIGHLRYVIHSNSATANPEHRLRFRIAKKCYGWVRRRIICPLFGPVDVLRFSMESILSWPRLVLAPS